MTGTARRLRGNGKECGQGRRKRQIVLGMGMLALGMLNGVRADTYAMVPRWGHASVYIPSPPSLLIQGGKTDPSSSSTYTSASNTGDTILLPLNSPFTASSTPFSLLSTEGPTYAWHTISTTDSSSDGWQGLSFGGDGGASEATQTQPDSAWAISANSTGLAGFVHLPSDWGDQPMRRIYHSSTSAMAGGKVYITGGLKDDGSGLIFSDNYAFDPTSSPFEPLPPLPQGIYHHTSVLLPNGTLVLVGGTYTSQNTGNPATLTLDTAYIMDTASTSPAWVTVAISGPPPEGRRGATLSLRMDGKAAYLIGGADVTLSEMYDSIWKMDFQALAWEPVDADENAPAGRFDHTSVPVGGDQVLVFGGLGASAPVDAGLYIFNTATETWQTDFKPVSSMIPSQPTSDSSGSFASQTVAPKPLSTGSDGVVVTLWSDQGVPPVITTSGGIIMTLPPPSPPSAPTATSSGTLGDAGANSHPLPTAAIIGLTVGAFSTTCILMGAMLYRYRRRRRLQALGAAWRGDGGTGPGSNRPYGSREKGGEGFMDDTRAEQGDGPSPTLPMSEKGPIGLGMGAIGASLASISNKFVGRGNPPADPYVEIPDEPGMVGGPMRKSSRRIGNGIRLIGPRANSQKYAPVRLGSAIRPRSSLSNARFDMLGEEDSREFQDDWCFPDEEEEDRWMSANSILGRKRQAFQRITEADEDPVDDDESLHPPIRGGPVPTPHASKSDLDPFDDGEYQLPSFSPSDPIDLNSLMPPTLARGSTDRSIPRSSRSGQSTSASDPEEGIIQHATFLSQQAVALISPPSTTTTSPAETSYQPIKRSESFFQRMAAGGITSLLLRQPTYSKKSSVDVRDPAPQPALWPIHSRDESVPEITPSTSSLHPPAGHVNGPSLSSLHSARSMRDMVVVRREASDNSVEIEPESASVSDWSSPGRGDREEPRAEGSSTHSRRLRSETPEEITFNVGDFARLSTPASASADTSPSSPSPPPHAPSSAIIPLVTRRNTLDTTPTKASTPTRPSAPPSGSPVPSPLVSHRRAVRDVVNSINRRGNSTPISLFSPTSQYSPQTSVSNERPATLYEAVRRSRLSVANPDWRVGSGNSQ